MKPSQYLASLDKLYANAEDVVETAVRSVCLCRLHMDKKLWLSEASFALARIYLKKKMYRQASAHSKSALNLLESSVSASHASEQAIEANWTPNSVFSPHEHALLCQIHKRSTFSKEGQFSDFSALYKDPTALQMFHMETLNQIDPPPLQDVETFLKTLAPALIRPFPLLLRARAASLFASASLLSCQPLPFEGKVPTPLDLLKGKRSTRKATHLSIDQRVKEAREAAGVAEAAMGELNCLHDPAAVSLLQAKAALAVKQGLLRCLSMALKAEKTAEQNLTGKAGDRQCQERAKGMLKQLYNIADADSWVPSNEEEKLEWEDLQRSARKSLVLESAGQGLPGALRRVVVSSSIEAMEALRAAMAALTPTLLGPLKLRISMQLSKLAALSGQGSSALQLGSSQIPDLVAAVAAEHGELELCAKALEVAASVVTADKRASLFSTAAGYWKELALTQPHYWLDAMRCFKKSVELFGAAVRDAASAESIQRWWSSTVSWLNAQYSAQFTQFEEEFLHLVSPAVLCGLTLAQSLCMTASFLLKVLSSTAERGDWRPLALACLRELQPVIIQYACSTLDIVFGGADPRPKKAYDLVDRLTEAVEASALTFASVDPLNLGGAEAPSSPKRRADTRLKKKKKKTKKAAQKTEERAPSPPPAEEKDESDLDDFLIGLDSD